MSRYFSHTPDWGADFHDTEKEARKAAEDALQEERDSAGSDGWRDEVTAICWGEVRERVVMTERVTREDPDPHDTARAVLERFDEYWSFALRPVEGAAPTWRDLVAQALPLLERAKALAEGEPLAQRVLGVALSTLRALLEADGPRPCAVRAESEEPAGLGVVNGNDNTMETPDGR